MLNIAIPKSDLARSLNIANGWQEFEIKEVYAKPGKKDPNSVTYVVVHKLVGDINEREVEHYFSSKALGMMNTWIAALTNRTVQEVLDSITSGTLNFDLEATVGKHLMCKVNQELFEGRIISKLIDFAPIGKVPF